MYLRGYHIKWQRIIAHELMWIKTHDHNIVTWPSRIVIDFTPSNIFFTNASWTSIQIHFVVSCEPLDNSNRTMQALCRCIGSALHKVLTFLFSKHINLTFLFGVYAVSFSYKLYIWCDDHWSISIEFWTIQLWRLNILLTWLLATTDI